MPIVADDDVPPLDIDNHQACGVEALQITRQFRDEFLRSDLREHLPAGRQSALPTFTARRSAGLVSVSDESTGLHEFIAQHAAWNVRNHERRVIEIDIQDRRHAHAKLAEAMQRRKLVQEREAVPSITLAHAEVLRAPDDVDRESPARHKAAVSERGHSINGSDARLPVAILIDPCDHGHTIALGLRFEGPKLAGIETENIDARVGPAAADVDDVSAMNPPTVQVACEPAGPAKILDSTVRADGPRSDPGCGVGD